MEKKTLVGALFPGSTLPHERIKITQAHEAEKKGSRCIHCDLHQDDWKYEKCIKRRIKL